MKVTLYFSTIFNPDDSQQSNNILQHGMHLASTSGRLMYYNGIYVGINLRIT
jgi:hypothetical protein